MDRCPNCGSSVRTGAKFCTTCGFRLPTATTTDQESPASRSPFDTTSSSATASRWPVNETEPARPAVEHEEPPADEAPPEPYVETDTLISEETAPDTGARADAATREPFNGWPAFASETGTETAWDRPVDNQNAVPETAPERSPQSVEEAIESWSSPTDDASRLETPESDEQTQEETGDHAWLAAAPEEQEPEADTSHIAESLPEVVWHPAESETVEPDLRSDEPVQAAELDNVQPVPVVDAAKQDIDPITRAAQLIDELRDLIPRISPGEAAKVSSSLDVAAELERIRDEAALDGEVFQSLRAAVATAQARPRDVDIMLDLVSRSGAMAEIIDAYERYRDAMDEAIKSLRGEQPEEPTPRW